MPQYIYYSIGKIFDNYALLTDWSNVVAVSDKNNSRQQQCNGRPLIGPEQISQFVYDYIVVFSSKYFDEIRVELAFVHRIDPDKIIPFQAILKGNNKSFDSGFEDFMRVFGSLTKKGYKIYDPYCLFEKNHIFLKEQIGKNLSIVSGLSSEYPIYRNLYDYTLENVDSEGKFDITVLGELSFKEELEEYIRGFMRTSRQLVFSTDYFRNEDFSKVFLSLKNDYDLRHKFEKSKIIYVLSEKVEPKWKSKGQIYGKLSCENIAVYVVSHKAYGLPADAMYRKILVGSYRESGCLTDAEGEDNIAFLNEKINECTAFYWLYKHAKDKYIGVCHYRRFFCESNRCNIDSILCQNQAFRLLSQYEMIVGECFKAKSSVLEHLRNTLNSDAFDEAYGLVCENIRKHAFDYLDAFDYVMEGHYYFICNMFITTKEIFDSYCKWLFSIIIPAAEKFNTNTKGVTTKYDTYSSRAIGFFAEVLFTVWLVRQKLKIKQLPVIRTDAIQNSKESGTIS